MHWALDQARFERGRSRASALANRYAVSRETSRKWLNGLSLPEMERMMEMAVDFEVSLDWLATGRSTVEGRSVNDIPATYRHSQPLSEDEMGVVQTLRRLPERKGRVLRDLIDLLE